MVVLFQMLLNFVLVVGVKDKMGLWGFICRYVFDVSFEVNLVMDQVVEFVLCYFNDFVVLGCVFCVFFEIECCVLEDLVGCLVVWDQFVDVEVLQIMVFVIGCEYGFELMKDWFQVLYQVLLGVDQGSCFGGFIVFYGVVEICVLIECVLVGELVFVVDY